MQNRFVISFVCSGFAMIEILVSIFILCVGVIGAAAMQSTALRTTKQAEFQTIALQLASDLADRIRSNVVPVPNNNSHPYLNVEFDGATDSSEVNISCYGLEASCTDIEIAQFELEEIRAKMKLLLPDGRLKICRDDSPWSDVSNQFEWECSPSNFHAPLVVKLGWREQRTHVRNTGTVVEEAGPQLVLTVGL